MENNKNQSGFTTIACWFVTLIAFAIEFWHAHLGLRELKLFGFEYGSLALSGILLMVLAITYKVAIDGNKILIWIYLLIATFMFVFNLNSFYPTYLGKKLIKEDAIQLKDTLDRYSAVLTKATGINVKETFGKVADLNNLKTTFQNEINGPGTINGVGSMAKSKLSDFNKQAGSNIDLGTTKIILTPQEKIDIVDNVSAQMDKAITAFILKQSPNQKNGYLLAISKLKMDSLVTLYNPILTHIQSDTSRFILDSVNSNSSIKKMKELATAFDGISKPLNTSLNYKLLPELDNENNQVSVPQTQELGRIAHTLSSVWKRIGKIDTIAILIVCLFIDFIVPLSMFLVLKNGNTFKRKENRTKPITY